jgi:hypothetical protein
MPANWGNVVCYARVGQHSEASLAYYYETRPADPDAPDVAALIREWANLGEPCEVTVRRRMAALGFERVG